MSTKAESLYVAFRTAIKNQHGVDVGPLSKNGEGAERAWFTLANETVPGLLEPVVAPAPEQVTIEGEIRQGKTPKGKTLKQAMPTHLTVRAETFGDMLARDGADSPQMGALAQRAHIMGVSVGMLAGQLDPADVEFAADVIYEMSGEDSWIPLLRAFIDANGFRPCLVDGCVQWMTLREMSDAGVQALDGQAEWRVVAHAALSEEHERHEMVHLRTAGASEGPVKVGPIYCRDLATYEDGCMSRGELHGQVAALAQVLDWTEDQVKGLRVEDGLHLMASVFRLKKKSEIRAASRMLARLSSRSTTGTETRSETSH